MPAAEISSSPVWLTKIATIGDDIGNARRNRLRASAPGAFLYPQGGVPRGGGGMGSRGRRGRPGRPPKDCDRDPLAPSLIALLAERQVIDAPQIQAAESFILLFLLVRGAPADWPVPPIEDLAARLDERCPALLGLADERREVLERLGERAGSRPARLLREAYAVATDFKLLERVLIDRREPAILAATITGAAYDEWQNLRRSLNALCKLFEIRRRDTELFSEGP